MRSTHAPYDERTMSALIALILLVAAGWFVTNLAGGSATGRREPMDSVHDFSRAMSALDPSRPMPAARPPVPARQPGPNRRIAATRR